jgi:ionotropic glutamate receptor
MVVPTKTKEARNTWAFMLPFTPTLWRTTGVFFVCTGIVIWLLEHRINPDFRGRPKDQVVTLLWYFTLYSYICKLFYFF